MLRCHSSQFSLSLSFAFHCFITFIYTFKLSRNTIIHIHENNKYVKRQEWEKRTEQKLTLIGPMNLLAISLTQTEKPYSKEEERRATTYKQMKR